MMHVGQQSSRLVLMLAAASLLLACRDPKNPQTWIKRLRDPEHAAEAVRQLRALGDPVAVPALCELFKDYPHTDILRTIITFKDRRAVPTLISALDFDEATYHNATLAAQALVELKAGEAVPALLRVLERPLPIKSRANLAKQEAIRALEKLGDRAALPALIKVLEAPPEAQDFYLNKLAAMVLGSFGDSAAVPALIRALFRSSTVQGSLFPQAEVALVQIGAPAVAPLIDALQGKDEALNALGKALEFRPGVVVNKTAIVLGSLRAREAVPVLIERLTVTDALRDPGTAGVIEALGKIGDRRAVQPLIALLTDAQADQGLRVQATTALMLIGDKRALPALLTMAEKGYLEGGLWDLRVKAADAYSGLVGAEAASGVPVIEAILADPQLSQPGYQTVRQFFVAARERIKLATACRDEVACYAARLSAAGATAAEREKAAIMIGALPDGRGALAEVVKALPLRDPVTFRQYMLEAVKRIGRAEDSALLAALRQAVERDGRISPRFLGADLASLDRIALAVVQRAR
ncbi:MAG: HEAT repeat domain-containing protein [Proteobacteria bacterium]|nr:HEAT repeat domain-containing protein [Pseudomonadota bacterium]